MLVVQLGLGEGYLKGGVGDRSLSPSADSDKLPEDN